MTHTADLAKILNWALHFGLEVEDVDHDVLGGFAIYLNGPGGRTGWISLLDSGARTIVHRDCGASVAGYVFDDAGLNRLKDFLT